jgi:hypothetical protein
MQSVPITTKVASSYYCNLNSKLYFVVGLVELWYFTTLSTIFQLYCGGKVFCWGKKEEPGGTPHPLQSTDKIFGNK